MAPHRPRGPSVRPSFTPSLPSGRGAEARARRGQAYAEQPPDRPRGGCRCWRGGCICMNPAPPSCSLSPAATPTGAGATPPRGVGFSDGPAMSQVRPPPRARPRAPARRGD
eukprot:scaffold207_cov409-Prasinococcus_capsulatus_cf.AAC.1